MAARNSASSLYPAVASERGIGVCMRGVIRGIAWAILLPVSSLVLMAQSASNKPSEVAALEQQVQSDLHENKPGLAIPLLRQIVTLDPKNLNGHANLGVLLYFDGQYADAIPEMRRALQIAPNLWKIRALLGIAEKRTGDPGGAQSDLEAAFPNLHEQKIQMEAGLELVELQVAGGQFDRALSVVSRLQEAAPQNPQLLLAAWQISREMTDQTLLNMMLAAPRSAEMHMMMAGELAREGDQTRAIQEYREAIRLNPRLPGVHYELAVQLRASPDAALNAQAEAEFKAAIEVNPYDEKSWRQVGEVIAARNDFKTAAEDFRKALALQPKDSDAETDLAGALISSNKNSEALPLLEQAVKDDPTNTAAHYRLSALYRRMGRSADAQREMQVFLHYKEVKDKLGKVFRQMAGPLSPNLQ
jgi:Flp pilus assembly protein TadD